MGIFNRIAKIVKAEVNHRLRQSGYSFNDSLSGDLEEEIRRLEEELERAARAEEAARERYNSQRQGQRGAGPRPRPKGPTAYQVLGISPQASQKEIKQRYRTLAKKFHPDVVQRLSPERQEEARNKMQQINQAYDKIDDPQKRRQYDLSISL